MIGTPVTGVETAWGEGQRPTSPATSLTSEGVQEIIVANNTRCASCPIAWPTRRPGSHDLPVTWLALSEFRYCRHNSHSVRVGCPRVLHEGSSYRVCIANRTRYDASAMPAWQR